MRANPDDKGTNPGLQIRVKTCPFPNVSRGRKIKTSKLIDRTGGKEGEKIRHRTHEKTLKISGEDAHCAVPHYVVLFRLLLPTPS
jgi:hypothetical protein